MMTGFAVPMVDLIQVIIGLLILYQIRK